MTTTANPRAFSGWTRQRFGPFLGLSAQQACLLAVMLAPLLLAMAQGRWVLLGVLVAASVPVALVVVLPVRGRPAYRWLVDLCWFGLGRLAGWAFWRSKAVAGASTPEELDTPDLPGVLTSLAFHDGPAFGPFQRRVGVVADPHEGLWTATGRISHPGLGTASADARDAAADALGALLAGAALTHQIARISLYVRTVPSDGAERAAWVDDHEVADVPAVVIEAGKLLEASMLTASVRHELFVTVTVSEAKIRKQATEAGRGVSGRARVLYRNLETIEQALREIGATDVEWLTTEQLAEAIRTGYSPADQAVLERSRQDTARNRFAVVGVPLAAAGPTTAPSPSARRYHHDSYTTVSYAVLLPELQTQVGALARMLAPSEAGERRCLAMHYEPIGAERSRKRIERSSWAMEVADEAKRSRGFRTDRRHERRLRETSDQEEQISAGHSLVRVAIAAAVTVPADWAVEDYAARFEGDGRACGFVPLRADLAQDSAFVAACLPLGIGLRSREDR